jgi:circadian clock protein KaiC
VNSKAHIQLLKTGMPGFDELLGGGIPEFSFNMIAGTPGSGKTTLAHQIMFSLASPARRALFFTVLGEPPLKMLRYQQQFPFFDVKKMNVSVRFCNLSADLLDENFDRIFTKILDDVREFSPAMVFVDSFRSVARSAQYEEFGASALQQFVQKLGAAMTGWLATTFLIGEYHSPEAESGPVSTVADSILALSQVVHRDAMVRKIQIVKMRGQAQSPGLHTFRITDNGIEIFPRALIAPTPARPIGVANNVRLSMGISELDEMMGGGLPATYSLLIVGPSGSGKTVLATQFLSEGARVGEAGIVASFEKSPNQLLGDALNTLVQCGQVSMLSTRALDLSIDEILHDLIVMIREKGAKRVVIDSLSGLELALAPMFRDDFRVSLYRLVAVLTGMGMTVLMTAELEDQYTQLRFSSYGNAFLADAIIMQRYIELNGDLRRVLSVVKVRRSRHSKQIRFFDIDDDGLVIGEPVAKFHGVLSGRASHDQV